MSGNVHSGLNSPTDLLLSPLVPLPCRQILLLASVSSFATGEDGPADLKVASSALVDSKTFFFEKYISSCCHHHCFLLFIISMCYVGAFVCVCVCIAVLCSCVCMYMCQCVWLHLCVTVYGCVCVHLRLTVYECVCVHFSVTVCVCASVCPVSVFVCACFL